MQLRISQGPTCALGIGEIVTPEEVRAAFLGLTKQFHPARFGRLSPDLQKLSNEVFLGIKAAHDHMLKVLGSSPASSRGGPSRRPSGAIPVITHGAEGTARMGTPNPRASQSIPRFEPVGGPPPSSTQPLARGTDRDARASSPVLKPRTSTPVMGVPITGRTTGTIPVQRVATPVPPGTQPGVGGTQPLARSTTPVPPGTQPGVGPSGSQRMMRVRTSTGAMLNVPAGQAGGTRQTTPPPVNTAAINPGSQPPRAYGTNLPPRPSTGQITPPTQPPRSDFNPPTVRNVQPAPSSQPLKRVPGFDESASFRDAAALMEQKNWPAAREALQALSTRVPHNKSYRAWLCYVRGREAYIAGRPDDAIAEMQRALQLQPDLAHARHALTELQRRR